jgi:hypothetical protein
VLPVARRPEAAFAGAALPPAEDPRVDELTHYERAQRADDDVQALAEDRLEGRLHVRHAMRAAAAEPPPRVGRHRDRGVECGERERDQCRRHDRQEPDRAHAEVVVDHVGREEHERPVQDADAEHERQVVFSEQLEVGPWQPEHGLELEQLDAEQLGEQRVACQEGSEHEEQDGAATAQDRMGHLGRVATG